MAIVETVREVKHQALASGGTETPRGWIDCTGKKYKRMRSYLANVLSAYELALIAPCFEVARKSQDFTITICQHDGFSTKLRQEDRLQQVLARLNDVVAPVARFYGIATRLEYKT
jgi:hypothetical protein